MTTAIATEKVHSTREGWLVAAIEAMRPMFEEALAAVAAKGHEVPSTLPAVRVSVGWPGGRGKKNTVIGQCWPTGSADDGVAQLFISPVLNDGARVLDVLLHELVHAVDDCKNGHKAAFKRIAVALGLEGKMTATTASEPLVEKLTALVEELGAYPHARLGSGQGADGPKKQGTRQLLTECAHGTGYKVRMTRKWLDEVGAPICPCHGEPMEEA